jgi:carboxylesterase type B
VPTVVFPLGTVRGRIEYAEDSNHPVHAFLGMPYTKSPNGELRFSRPLLLETPWDDVFDATEYGETETTCYHRAYMCCMVYLFD